MNPIIINQIVSKYAPAMKKIKKIPTAGPPLGGPHLSYIRKPIFDITPFSQHIRNYYEYLTSHDDS